MEFRPATQADILGVTNLAAKLFPDMSYQELEEEMKDFIASAEDTVIYLAVDDALPIAFAQCQLRRDYVEGTETSPVGYLEGIYVEPTHRRQKVASQLIKHCENWSRKKGCTEFASDCELDNHESWLFHMTYGFFEANRIICFTKKI